jgi:hypothetical protein
MDKRAETISVAREFLESHWGVTQPQAVTQAISIVMADFHLSQSRDAWTPVGERLPTKSGEYLVTRQMNVPVIDVVTFYHDDKRRGFWGGCIPDVVAWMPLPGPYEQEK